MSFLPSAMPSKSFRGAARNAHLKGRLQIFMRRAVAYISLHSGSFFQKFWGRNFVPRWEGGSYKSPPSRRSGLLRSPNIPVLPFAFLPFAVPTLSCFVVHEIQPIAVILCGVVLFYTIVRFIYTGGLVPDERRKVGGEWIGWISRLNAVHFRVSPRSGLSIPLRAECAAGRLQFSCGFSTPVPNLYIRGPQVPPSCPPKIIANMRNILLKNG